MSMYMHTLYLDAISDDQFDLVFDAKYDNFDDFLKASFDFKNSNEGEQFWLDLSKVISLTYLYNYPNNAHS